MSRPLTNQFKKNSLSYRNHCLKGGEGSIVNDSMKALFGFSCANLRKVMFFWAHANRTGNQRVWPIQGLTLNISHPDLPNQIKLYFFLASPHLMIWKVDVHKFERNAVLADLDLDKRYTARMVGAGNIYFGSPAEFTLSSLVSTPVSSPNYKLHVDRSIFFVTLCNTKTDSEECPARELIFPYRFGKFYSGSLLINSRVQQNLRLRLVSQNIETMNLIVPLQANASSVVSFPYNIPMQLKLGSADELVTEIGVSNLPSTNDISYSDCDIVMSTSRVPIESRSLEANHIEAILVHFTKHDGIHHGLVTSFCGKDFLLSTECSLMSATVRTSTLQANNRVAYANIFALPHSPMLLDVFFREFEEFIPVSETFTQKFTFTSDDLMWNPENYLGSQGHFFLITNKQQAREASGRVDFTLTIKGLPASAIASFDSHTLYDDSWLPMENITVQGDVLIVRSDTRALRVIKEIKFDKLNFARVFDVRSSTNDRLLVPQIILDSNPNTYLRGITYTSSVS